MSDWTGDRVRATENGMSRLLGKVLHDCRKTHGGWRWQDSGSTTLDHRPHKQHFPTRAEALRTAAANNPDLFLPWDE